MNPVLAAPKWVLAWVKATSCFFSSSFSSNDQRRHHRQGGTPPSSTSSSWCFLSAVVARPLSKSSSRNSCTLVPSGPSPLTPAVGHRLSRRPRGKPLISPPAVRQRLDSHSRSGADFGSHYPFCTQQFRARTRESLRSITII